jgi:hypothetical protein
VKVDLVAQVDNMTQKQQEFATKLIATLVVIGSLFLSLTTLLLDFLKK